MIVNRNLSLINVSNKNQIGKHSEQKIVGQSWDFVPTRGEGGLAQSQLFQTKTELENVTDMTDISV